MDTSCSPESKVPSFSHRTLAELGKWHGVSVAGRLCRLGSDLRGKLSQLHSEETPLLQKRCCRWVSTPAKEDSEGQA